MTRDAPLAVSPNRPPDASEVTVVRPETGRSKGKTEDPTVLSRTDRRVGETDATAGLNGDGSAEMAND